MSPSAKGGLIAPAIRIAAAGLGALVAGPVGAAVAGLIGVAALTPAAAAMVSGAAEKFGDAAGEKLIESGSDALIDRLTKTGSGLEDAYREALRSTLAELPKKVKAGYEDWFKNWDLCLKHTGPRELSTLHPEKLLPDDTVRRTLELLDAQGVGFKTDDLSFNLKIRQLPDALLADLLIGLPTPLERNFKALITSPDYDRAWKEQDSIFQTFTVNSLGKLIEKTDSIKDDTAATRAMMERLLASALGEGRVTPDQLQAKDAEIARLTEAYNKLKEELAARASEPAEAALSKLVNAGEIEKAIALKSKQVASHPRDYFELGTLHELHYDWPSALATYKRAWELERNPLFGFKYAYASQRQNHFRDAIEVYEDLRKRLTDPVRIGNTLNNLANLYSDTQRMKEAETAYTEALDIYRKLALASPEAYLPDVAMTLNNLAVLYRAIQRMTEADKAYTEALDIYRKLALANPEAYLPDVAMTLNNLAILYRATQRMADADNAYTEALDIYRKLALANPEAYLPDVAMTLNNLAILYRATQRMADADNAYTEALDIRRKLALANPEAYLPNVATTLNNLAILYSDTQHMTEADKAYTEALDIYRKLALANPEAYLPDVAMTLNNLAILYRATQRTTEADKAYTEALDIYRKLALANPDAYLPDVAMTLNNLANLYRATQRMTEADKAYTEALDIRRELALVNPDAYLPDVAMTLNNLAILYRATQRMTEADKAYTEALDIYRKLALASPEAYLPDVAMTLNNLAILYSDTQFITEAEACCREALEILKPLWEANPELHGDQMGRVLFVRALVREQQGEPSEAICADARRALAVAYAPDIKQGVQAIIDRHCGASA